MLCFLTKNTLTSVCNACQKYNFALEKNGLKIEITTLNSPFLQASSVEKNLPSCNGSIVWIISCKSPWRKCDPACKTGIPVWALWVSPATTPDMAAPVTPALKRKNQNMKSYHHTKKYMPVAWYGISYRSIQSFSLEQLLIFHLWKLN